ncbi:MAG: hypothetical protein AAB634_00955, partial [Patescibacteria group bacterium]
SVREVAFDFDTYSTLVPNLWTITAFYVNTAAPDKGEGSQSTSAIFNDGLSRLSVQYTGCQSPQTTAEPSLRNSTSTQCSGGFRNAYYPSGANFPPSGTVTFIISGGSYTSADYITILFLKFVSGSSFQQIGRYVVPVYFTESPGG